MINDLAVSVVTTCKQSLGQGNIFIGVCQEFCSQRGCLVLGGCLVPGGCLLLGGCLFWGGAWSRGGSATRGCLLLGGGVCSWEVPSGDPATGTAAGGTHPTGMHSCFHPFIIIFFIYPE